MPERGWQDEIIERIPSGVDTAQIDDWLRLTPTERLERLRAWIESIERAREADGDGLPETA